MLGKTEEGRLTPEECVRRLKNWVVLGNDSSIRPSWQETGSMRDCHVAWGGARLHELASDNTSLATHGFDDDVLDSVCASL